jgi:hypothetical protein
MALKATCSTYYQKRPGYVNQERRTMFARLGDWAFMTAHCKHKRRHTKACLGVGYHGWARPEDAK